MNIYSACIINMSYLFSYSPRLVDWWSRHWSGIRNKATAAWICPFWRTWCRKGSARISHVQGEVITSKHDALIDYYVMFMELLIFLTLCLCRANGVWIQNVRLRLCFSHWQWQIYCQFVSHSTFPLLLNVICLMRQDCKYTQGDHCKIMFILTHCLISRFLPGHH